MPTSVWRWSSATKFIITAVLSPIRSMTRAMWRLGFQVILGIALNKQALDLKLRE
jgi:hypothetical protein